MLTIGFLGGGNMAGALIGGLLAGGPRSDRKVHVTDLHEDKLARLAALGAQTHSGVGEWAASCDLMVFAVKPQGMKTALASLMPFLNPDGAALTIAAGIEAAAYADWLNGYPLMRAMPNTPAMVGMGVSGLWIPAGISDTAANAARQVLAAAGKVVEVKTEADIDLSALFRVLVLPMCSALWKLWKKPASNGGFLRRLRMRWRWVPFWALRYWLTNLEKLSPNFVKTLRAKAVRLPKRLR